MDNFNSENIGSFLFYDRVGGVLISLSLRLNHPHQLLANFLPPLVSWLDQ